MGTPVAVLERMDVDETERRRVEHGVELSLLHALVRSDHPLHQVLQVLRARAAEFRRRIAIEIPLAKENAVRPQADPCEARVFDQHCMETKDFVKRQRVLSGLQHRASSPLEPASRRLFTLDLEAGAAVRQQEKTN